MEIDGVKVKADFDISENEARNYINYVLSNVKIQNTPLFPTCSKANRLNASNIQGRG